jgi:hypothetical protein
MLQASIQVALHPKTTQLGKKIKHMFDSIFNSSDMQGNVINVPNPSS